MARIRLSTTVDASLLARNGAHEIDASYAAYDDNPVDQPDEWGDLDSWRREASAS